MPRSPLPAPYAFLSAFDRPVADLALGLREILLDEAPDAVEKYYANHASAVWYGFGPDPKISQMALYIAAATKHVNLGFCRGASLPDPNRILEGTGKAMRHIKFRTALDLDRPFLRRYIRAAVDHSRR